MGRKKDIKYPEIDFVIAWVDGSDPEWLKEKSQYAPPSMADSATEVRYRDWDNLRYWFRAVENYAPWVRRIHFITWGHLPKWLDTRNPKLNIVNHRDYIPHEYLPTFNSHTIELNMHRIEGLSEHFVYFNDDMFLTRPVSPEDFFRDGKPMDTFGLNCVFFGGDSAGHFVGSNMEVINTEFKGQKRSIMKRDFKKWFARKNGRKNRLKTFLLIPWDWFPGFHYDHLASDLCKSTICEVWESYGDVLDKTCRARFRQEFNVNQWLFKFWQFCKGNYQVRSDRFGKAFHIEEENFEELCSAIREQKYSMICVNDTPRTLDPETKKQRVRECFDTILPDKCSYEK